MNILIVAPKDTEQEELIAFSFEAKYGLKINFVTTIAQALEELEKVKAHQDALKLLKDTEPNQEVASALKEIADVEMIIVSEMDGLETLFDFIEQEEILIPVVLRTTQAEKARAKYSEREVINVADEKNVIPELHEIFSKLAAQPNLSGADLLFCPVRISLIQKFSPLNCDLYIRLSKQKYIKVMHANEPFTDEEYERFTVKKKQDCLHVKRENFDTLFSSFHVQLDKVMKDDAAPIEEVRETVVASYETLHELIARVGFSDGVRELAEKSVQTALKAIGTNPTVAQIIKAFQADRSKYLAQHSLLLAEVACALAVDMGWGSDTNYARLTSAAILHDITLGDNDLARVRTLDELEQGEFNETQKEKFKKHPLEAADMMKQFKSVPPDAADIVLQHHELPMGEGFPRGLQHNYISNLSSLFIIAHEVVGEIVKQGEQFDMFQFFDRYKGKYSQGKFREIIKAIDPVIPEKE